MAALAYLLPPLSGLLAYALSGSERVRFHGLQAVAFGVAWPLGLRLAALAGPWGTRAAFALGALVWVGLFLATLAGADPRLPGARRLRAWAAPRPGE